LQQRKELEEINIADGIKTVQEAAGKYVNDHWRALTKGGAINGVDIPAIPPGGDVIPIAIDDAELANYLPADFDRGNPFNGAFRIAVKRRPDAKKPIQAVVISGNATRSGAKLDDMSGVRIAAMVGSGGGVIRSDTNEASGTMGLWKLDGPALAAMFANPDDLQPVRVVATSDFALDETENPLWKSVLFRENRSEFPYGNAMLTDIDMAGEKDPATGKWKNNNIVNLNALRRKLPDGTTEDVFTVDNDTGLVTFKKDVKIEGKLTGAEAEFSGDVKVGSLAVKNHEGAVVASVDSEGNIAGKAGTFSDVITANANATPGAACSGGQMAKNGDSTLICDKGKWIKAEELATGDRCMMCMQQYKNYYSNLWNIYQTCSWMIHGNGYCYYHYYYKNSNNVTVYTSTHLALCPNITAVYNQYKDVIPACNFTSIPLGWIDIFNASDQNHDTYYNYNNYISIYMKIL
jgi:hypothetical protein